jgi:hypothetical protein
MNILNFEALNKAGLNKFPWEWGVLEDLISRDFACKLEKESKNLCFKRVHAQRSDKSYNMGMYEVDGSLDQNSAIAQLANEIKTEKYILALENFSNLSLINKRISINVWQYTHEDYLSPHVDKPEISNPVNIL